MTMTHLIRANFQAHPFHLVSPSPWPLFTCVALLTLTTAGVLTMHGFSNAGYLLTLGFISLIGSMAFWFRDVISEGTYFPFEKYKAYILKVARVVTEEEKKVALDVFKKIFKNLDWLDKQLGWYLAGLLEGDGNINIPALGKTILARVLNPRITYTFHRNNLGFYVYLQNLLGGVGRFQARDKNTMRYIIGDKEGIKKLILLMHNKLRTPKNITFNKLIQFMNSKYSLNIATSVLDTSCLANNSWLAGLTDTDGYLGVKTVSAKPKSETRKRSVSASINLIFKLEQRSFDRPTSTSMLPLMEEIGKFLSCNVIVVKKNPTLPLKLEPIDTLSVSVTSLDKIKPLIDYFNKYPILGVKGLDFKD